MAFFNFGGAQFQLAGDAALYWPAHRALIVADLHLEKASSYAIHGQMLPPYDSRATLELIADSAREYDAQAVICLGDNFHDVAGEARLQGEAAALLQSMTRAYDWTWITGNHDPDVAALWGGVVVVERILDGIMLRHQAEPGWNGPEISGHFHPKLRMIIRRRSVSRRAFVISDTKIIMPAFGALTGGMDASDPVITAAMGGASTQAFVPVKGQLCRFALHTALAK